MSQFVPFAGWVHPGRWEGSNAPNAERVPTAAFTSSRVLLERGNCMNSYFVAPVARLRRVRVAAVAALLLAAACVSIGAWPAHALAACLPTPYMQDGMPLTAQYVNPPDGTLPQN